LQVRQTPARRIAKIHAVVDQLNVAPDPHMLADLRARFPSLTQEEIETASQQLSWDMRQEKQASQGVASQYQTDFLRIILISSSPVGGSYASEERTPGVRGTLQ
jgi:hypothetical protein